MDRIHSGSRSHRATALAGRWSVSLALALGGCASTEPPAPTPSPVATPGPEPASASATPIPPKGAATIPDDCVLRAARVEPPVLHSGLRAVAAQYFHASHRGGFDGYTGGREFPWYDLYSLGAPILSPAGTRIATSTEHSLFVAAEDGRLGVMPRDGTTVTYASRPLYPEEAVETRAGVRWVLARSGSAWHIVQFDRKNRSTEVELPVSPPNWDVRIALTASDQLVVAWLERSSGTLAVHVAWEPTGEGSVIVDQVELPDAVAELSARSRVNLSLAADGREGVAVAWRPLTDPDYPDAGAMLPQTPAKAEVRWLRVPSRRGGAPTAVQRHPTRALPLGGATGIGPWPLYGNGMKGHRFGDRGLFVWLDDGGVSAVRAHQDKPVVLADREGSPLIAPWGADQVLLFDSSPQVRALELRCSPEPAAGGTLP